ncbi:response regulator [Endozoicomonas sp. SM1973]|uniref:Response regulator n=1 Tax=Spartinivicinus marinus TaxID=2994442 RepID=A0A853HVF8_9GAMM|nr:response regulator [Spartinivicinus marinus]MCX4025747.1 response regulator [Spartinivicinus marinus]NYZ65740.1 response regulator [Spartinivicinus marinus]
MQPVNILLVDDQLSSLLVLEDLLASLKVNLLKATSAKDALMMMLDNDISCILLDVSMPEMDGFEFLKTLQAAPTHANIPVIMVTGKIFSENETLRAYQYGAVDFLIKPLDAHVVYRKVSFFVHQALRIKCIESIEHILKNISTDIIKPLKKITTKDHITDDGLLSELTQAMTKVEELQQNWSKFQHAKQNTTL